MYDINSNILQKTGVTASQLDSAMKSIRSDHMLSDALDAIVAAENKHGINALFIAAHAATETGWGHSLMARTKNNLFGFNAVDSNPGRANVYPSKAASVEHYSQFLMDNYLQPGGRYFNGATPHGVMVRYASAGDRAANTIVQIMNSFAEHIGVSAVPSPNGFPERPASTEQKDDSVTSTEQKDEASDANDKPTKPAPTPATTGKKKQSTAK